MPSHQQKLSNRSGWGDERGRGKRHEEALDETHLFSRAWRLTPPARMEGERRVLRKRKALDKDVRRMEYISSFLSIASESSRIIVFTGSGISASAGLSTFTSKGGLYERAMKRFKVKDGMKLFCNSHYRRHPKDCLALMGEIYDEATAASPTEAHLAIGRLETRGRLVRHYTMNIDGLHQLVRGATTWTGVRDCPGKTVSLHGCCRELLCTNASCDAPKVSTMTQAHARAFKGRKDVRCSACSEPTRPKIMLYDDADSELITPDLVMEVMDEDISKCDLVLWVGISFQQSASLEYFRNVQRVIKELGRGEEVTQAIINPDEDSWFNAISGMNNMDNTKVIPVVCDANTILSEL